MTDLDITMYEALVRELIMIRDQKNSLAKREKELRDAVPPYLQQIGEPTGPMGQHLSHELDPPIRGVKRVVWQTKVSQSPDEERAMEIAEREGIVEDIFVMSPVLSEEAVMVALDDGLITRADIEEIFPKRVSHALVFEKDKK